MDPTDSDEDEDAVVDTWMVEVRVDTPVEVPAGAVSRVADPVAPSVRSVVDVGLDPEDRDDELDKGEKYTTTGTTTAITATDATNNAIQRDLC